MSKTSKSKTIPSTLPREGELILADTPSVVNAGDALLLAVAKYIVNSPDSHRNAERDAVRKALKDCR